MAITLYSAQVSGLAARPIAVEVDITPGLHVFSIVGLADKEVQESRERISAAMRNIGALPPHKKGQRIIVNLAPADIKKEGPAFDLPIALGYLLASKQISFNPEKKLFLGELGLDGSLRSISGMLPTAMIARGVGFKEVFVPKGNGSEAAIIEGITVFEAENLSEIIEHIAGRAPLAPLPKTDLSAASNNHKALDFTYIRGQESAKTALEIAAAGAHNVLMSGPPGAGKTILARALPSILPRLSFEAALEVTKIYSVAGALSNDQPFVTESPFRNPHHTASHTAVIGGGPTPRPGEITLAHRGVLFLDELPEFDRRVIEALRQPMEEANVTISRVRETLSFPADFMLVGAMNPCPCGYDGSQRIDCSCSPAAVTRYKKKISGPMMDRIDIHVHTPSVTYEKLEGAEGEPSRDIRTRVEHARAIQKNRFRGTTIETNSQMGIGDIKKYIPLTPELRTILQQAHERYALSARAYHRLLKLARTIADLAGAADVTPDHIIQALTYRPRQEV